MQSKQLLPKRVIRKIAYSTATIAIGIVLWSNVSKSDYLCVPGGPNWPKCAIDNITEVEEPNFEASVLE